jgi:hypothetical protein
MNSMPRKHIPDSLQASLLAANAGVCCVCKTRGVGTNFHHIDHNNSNNEPKNIAVLCVRDHDAHHRPLKYPALNHLDLSAEEIREYKDEWERFVREARQSHPKMLAVLNVYGTPEYIHSMRLLFQWVSGKIVLERMYHLTDGPFEQWADLALREAQWLGSAIKLVSIDQPLEIKYCPCCQTSMANTLDTNVATRLTAPDWSDQSAGALYINPSQPSPAIHIAYRDQAIVTASLHRCGNYLHFACEKYVERVPIRKHPSVRTQARAIVQKFINDWTPGKLLIGTGDPDAPELVPHVDLPRVWEQATA